MSFLDAFEISTRADPDLAEKTVPRGFGERFDLEWKAARAPDKWFFYENRMRALYDEAIDALAKRTGQRAVNPFALLPGRAPTMEQTGEFAAPPRQREDVLPEVFAAFDKARGEHPDLPNPRLFDDKIRAEATKLRQDAARAALAGYGASGLGAFLGAAGGELSHPVNLATLPLGGSYAVGNIARVGLLRYIGRAALAESAVAAASQTAIEIADAPYQERLGTDTGIGDRLERIFIAGAGGALFGLGLSGLVAAARGLRRRLNPTLDEADALKVAERASLHDGKNPLGPEGVTAHARAVETAEVQVAAGRHANVDEIVREEVQRQVAQTIGDAPKRGLVVAARTPEGLVVYGKPGQVHAELTVTGSPLFKDPAVEMGWAGPEGRFMTREEALAALPKGDPVRDMPVAAQRGRLEAIEFNEVARQERALAPSQTGFTEAFAGLRGGAIGANLLRDIIDRAKTGRLTGPFAADPLAKKLKPEIEAGRINTVEEAQAFLSQASAPAQALDPTATTRAIADAAPPVPEKAAATAKAEMALANARAIAETNAGAKAALESASEEAKMANKVKNCAMGIAIG